jgi:SAM-dependent methyltransferase
MATPLFPNLFDAYYYEHGCGTPYGKREDWLVKYGRIADLIARDIQPKTMLDAGCAYGYMIETMRQRGVECWGIDISEHAIQSTHPDARPYCRVASILDPLPQNYDLITCFEVVEHMPSGLGEQAIGNLCMYTDDILFCSSPVDFKEVTHLNVQPVEYWAELFAVQGFYRDVDFDASVIVSWAARYRRIKEPFHRVARQYERKFWQLLKENREARLALIELHSQLNLADQERTTLLGRLTTVAAQLAAQVNQHSAQDQLIAQISQPANLKKSIKDSIHLLRVKLTPPGSRRERWYESLRGRKAQ